jgi:hypothetical protein
VNEIKEVTFTLECEINNDVGISQVTLIIYLRAESAETSLW